MQKNNISSLLNWKFSYHFHYWLSALIMLGLSFVELEPVQRRWLSGLILLVLALEYLIGRQNTLELTPDALRWTQRGWLTGKRVLDVPSVILRRVHYQRAVHWWQRDKIVLERKDKTNVRLNVTDWHTADNGDTLVGAIVKHPIFSKLLEQHEWQGLQVDDHEEKAAIYRGQRQLIYGLILVMLFALFVMLDPHITLIWGWYWAAVAVLFLLTCYFGYPILKTKMNQASPVIAVLTILLFGLVACSSLLPLISATSHSKPVFLTLSRADKGGEYWQLRQGITVGCAPTGRAIGSQQSTLLYTHAWLGMQRVNHQAICRVSD